MTTPDSPKGPEDEALRARVAEHFRVQWGYAEMNDWLKRCARDAVDALRPELERVTFERDAAQATADIVAQQLEDLRDDVLGDDSLHVLEVASAAGRELERLTAEVERLRRELEMWTSGRRRKAWPVIESVPDGIHYAAELARAQGTEGGEEHDRLLREASQRLKALHDVAQVLLADRDVLSAEVSRLREQLAAQPTLPQDAETQIARAIHGYWDLMHGASGEDYDKTAAGQAHQVMKVLRSWGVSSSEVEAPQPQRKLDVIKGEQLARIHRFVRDLKDSVPDVTGDPVQDAFNRGYAEADVLTGGALGALLNVRFNEVLDSPEFRAALDDSARDSAPSEASQHHVLVVPHLKDWWASSCRECAVTNYTQSRESAEDWKDQHEADTLRPTLATGGLVEAGTLGLRDESVPPGLVVPQRYEGRPSGSERLAPRPSEAAALVRDFHEAFGLPINDTTRTLNKLRANLVREEGNEAADAIEDDGPEAWAKELADLVIVAYGAALTLGIDLDEAVRLVHHSNMSKLGTDGKPVMRPDGKVLKGPNYVPPDMSSALLQDAAQAARSEATPKDHTREANRG